MYQGKLFSVLGDSISTLEGYSVPADATYYGGFQAFRAQVFAPEDTWWGKLIAHLGGELLVNHSISGSLCARHPQCVVPSYGCSDERTAALGRGDVHPDVILILLGTNDWGWRMPLMPPDGREGDEGVFSVAYDRMLKKLKRNYPNAELWCFTLPVGADLETGHASAQMYNDVIRTCAVRHGGRVPELYRVGQSYDTVDGLHPSAEGMRQMAEHIFSQL